MKIYNYVTAAAVAAIAAFVLAVASGFPPGEHNTMSAGFWPCVLALALLALALMLAVATLRQKQDEPIAFFATPGQKKVWLTVGLLVGFVAAIRIAGFYLANIVFIPLMANLMGEKDTTRLLAIDLCANAFVYIVFTVLLNIRLPGPVFG